MTYDEPTKPYAHASADAGKHDGSTTAYLRPPIILSDVEMSDLEAICCYYNRSVPDSPGMIPARRKRLARKIIEHNENGQW